MGKQWTNQDGIVVQFGPKVTDADNWNSNNNNHGIPAGGDATGDRLWRRLSAENRDGGNIYRRGLTSIGYRYADKRRPT